MSTDTIVDAEVVDETPTTDLVVQQPTGHVTAMLVPLADPEEVREVMVAYQRTVEAVLDPSDWQGRPGQRGSFVKKSGWRKIAKAYGISVTYLNGTGPVEYRDENGQIVRATAAVRATGPNGQWFDGSGACSIEESRFQKAGGRQKADNDVPATAETRAMNRAISSLVGFGEVSADEVTQDDNDDLAAIAAEWAQPIDQAGDHAKAFRGALGQLAGPDKAADLYRDLTTECDGLPAIVAGFVLKVYEART